jgi:hypothetical protein
MLGLAAVRSPSRRRGWALQGEPWSPASESPRELGPPSQWLRMLLASETNFKELFKSVLEREKL